VSEQDPHAPTHAGPSPLEVEPEPTPTPVIGAADATASRPPGTAAFPSAAEDPNPERKVGAAFAGGLVAALFLKSLANRRHR
jgi:hypothetical protein